MSTVIKVENLSKKYTIRHEHQGRYSTLRDTIVQKTIHMTKRIISPFTGKKEHTSAKEEIWALRGVSFEVKQGERIGIIGRNGSGKSTLLKLLSRITEPTEGRIHLKGRVASLLEVGTGFHPELTGRENIFLNGAVLGMSRAEIKRKFDQIVDFSGVEKFLDTPVKRYSSGMQVRLAFSVAAHLEPEILLVDEVLAVGDHEFQKKCLGKMDEVAKAGRTVLFVSHNMGAVSQLCSRGIILNDGNLQEQSENISLLIRSYLNQRDVSTKSYWRNSGNEHDNQWFKPLLFCIVDSNETIISSAVTNNDDCWVLIEGVVNTLNPILGVGYAVYSDNGTLLYWSMQTDQNKESWPIITEGVIKLKSKIPSNIFNIGTYRFEMIAGFHFTKWLFEPSSINPVFDFSVNAIDCDSPYLTAKRPGLLAPVLEWSRSDN